MVMRGTLFTVMLTVLIAGPIVGPAMMRLSPESAIPAGKAKPAPNTVAARLADFGSEARARLRPALRDAGLSYPPTRLRLAAFKKEQRIDLYAADHENDTLRFVKSYDFLAGPQPITAAHRGPKLFEGDRRVPEGLYRLGYLNPRSIADVSIRIGYPNRFDRARALDDGRDPETIGSDIMLHGPTNGTEGCLSLEKPDIEEVFTLLADTRAEAKRRGEAADADILIAPRDFRIAQMDDAAIRDAVSEEKLPDWTPTLYRDIDRSVNRLPPREPAKSFRAILASDD